MSCETFSLVYGEIFREDERMKTKESTGRTESRTILAAFMSELGKTNGTTVFGFALCQCWIALCFFAPQLFSGNVVTNVYELSLAVTAISLIPGICAARKMDAVTEKKSFVYATAAAAGVGTMLIPFSSLSTFAGICFMAIAAILTGFASGWLFVSWYKAFCNANDYIGFALSVATQSVILYVFTNILLPPVISPWITLAIACLIPLVSAYMLVKTASTADTPACERIADLNDRQRRTIVHLCVSMFVVSLVDEFMRNYYLEDTDLAFYAGEINLVLITLKIVFSVLTIVFLSRSSSFVPNIYKVSIITSLAAVLFMPYLPSSIGYGLTNFGAFIFKIMVMLISFNCCKRSMISPILLFSLTRLTWSLDLLLGYFLFNFFNLVIRDGSYIGIVSVVMGLLVIATYLFLFTSANENPLWRQDIARPKPTSLDDFPSKCDHIAKVGKLTKREAEILSLIARGRSTPRIQDELHVSANTVNTHTSHIYQKLGIHSRQELLDLVDKTTPSGNS